MKKTIIYILKVKTKIQIFHQNWTKYTDGT